MKEPNSQRKQLEQQVIEKAMKDELFLGQLLEDPKGTIEKAYSIKLPETVNIHILQEDPQSFYLVLPPRNAHRTPDELSEKELAFVAGAGDGYSIQGCAQTYALFCY